mmetsp:Transcript_26705/g.72057  ORF Transcript_26705/g.72057 Transcript_26705/m.72057 type:complete len:467 (+) Transcript_26705:34-1434(+)
MMSSGGSPVARFAPGSSARCVRLDGGEARLCEVLESRRVMVPGRQPAHEYYVHYRDTDRRLDEWVTEGRLVSLEGSRDRALKRGHRELECLLDHRRRARAARLSAPGATEQLDLRTLSEHVAATRIKNVRAVALGRWRMDAWYFSPYPCIKDDGMTCDMLRVCEFCLAPSPSASLAVAKAHACTCPARHPPGCEIYRDGDLSVFEVSGKDQPTYSSRLCLLAKLFLDHKVLWRPEDVHTFRYYVLCEAGPHGYELLGYFSKDQSCPHGYNLACLLTLPPHQRKGYGHLLIDLSYALSRRDGRQGGPERPLSDLGRRGYLAYWTSALVRDLERRQRLGLDVSVHELAVTTGISEEEVKETLSEAGLIQWDRDGAPYVELAHPLLAAHGMALPSHNDGASGPTGSRQSPTGADAKVVGSEQSGDATNAPAPRATSTARTIKLELLRWDPPCESARRRAPPKRAAAPLR